MRLLIAEDEPEIATLRGEQLLRNAIKVRRWRYGAPIAPVFAGRGPPATPWRAGASQSLQTLAEAPVPFAHPRTGFREIDYPISTIRALWWMTSALSPTDLPVSALASGAT